MNEVIIVKDNCIDCRNLWKTVEFGSCDCNSDYTKGLSPAEISWLKRHGKTVEIQKPYSMVNVGTSFKKLKSAMETLVVKGQKLRTVTKNVVEESRKRKLRNSKSKLEISVSKVEKSKQDLLTEQGKIAKRDDDLVILGILQAGLKGKILENWVEKRAGLR